MQAVESRKANKRSLFNAPGIGSTIGAMVAGAPGATVGNLAGQAFRAITGYGDYNLVGGQRNQAPLPMGQPMARVSSGGGGVFRISHREFISDVVELGNNSGAFTARTLSINAGNPVLFPWLSQMAGLFDQYRIAQMVFTYKSTSSFINGAGTGQGLGVVVMATDYDSADTVFASKQQMEATQFATSCAACESMYHPIECKRGQTVLPVLYVRTTSVPSGKDIRMYDMGYTVVATQGIPNSSSSQTMGELWVSYTIELLKPILSPSQPIATGTGTWFSVVFNSTTVSNTAAFGLSSYINDSAFFIDGTIAHNDYAGLVDVYFNPTSLTNTINVVNRTSTNFIFAIIYAVTGVSTVLTTALTTTFTSTITSTANLWFGGGLSGTGQIAASTSTLQYVIRTLTAGPGSGYITLNTATFPTSITAVRFSLVQLS